MPKMPKLPSAPLVGKPGNHGGFNGKTIGKPQENGGLPSGERLHNYGKIHPFLMGKLTINIYKLPFSIANC